MKPTHIQRAFDPKREFTDRDEERTRFVDALRMAQAPDEYLVISWYGVGGQGKSALSREFMRLSAEQDDDVAAARLNLDDPKMRRIEIALLAIRLQLSQVFGHRFGAFDTAFARHFVLTNPGINIRQKHPELFRGENPLLDDLIDWSEVGIDTLVEGASLAVPGLNLLYRYLGRLSARAREWLERRGKDVLRGLDQLSADEILDRLPSYLGSDICDLLETRPKRTVVVIDTHEALWRDHSVKDMVEGARADAWLRLLVQDAPGVLFTILGRDKLRWHEIDPDWDELVESHLLGALSADDVDHFLRAVPITSERIRHSIVDSARGLPFYLDLQVDLYAALLDKGKAPEPADFNGDHPAILRRFLDHIGERDRTILRLLSYPERPSELLLNNLAEAFLGGAAAVNWSDATRQSVMEPATDGGLVMHVMMREALQKREQEERFDLFTRIHAHLLEYFLAEAEPKSISQITTKNEAALLELPRHLLAASIENWYEILDSALNPFIEGYRYAIVEGVCEKVIDIFEEDRWALEILEVRSIWARSIGRQGRHATAEAELRSILSILWQPEYGGEESLLALSTRANIAFQVSNQGRHREAEAELRDLLQIQRRPEVLGERHPSTLATRFNLASEIEALGRYAEAEAELRDVLELRRAADDLGEEHPDTLSTRQNIATMLGSQGRYEEALAELRAVLEIERLPEVLGEKHPSTLATRANIAHELGNLGRHIEAEKELRAVLEISRSPDVSGEEHIETLITRDNIASELGAQGRHVEAEAELRSILAIKRRPDVLGEEHPSTLRTRHNLALQMGAQGRHVEAEAELRSVLKLQCRAEGLGDEHPETLTMRHNLAFQVGKQGRHREAEIEFRAILEAYERNSSLGLEHPGALSTRNSLASELGEQGRFGEAEMALRTILDFRRRLLGEEHPDTLNTRTRIALQISHQERHEEAKQELSEVYEIQRRPHVLGERHPHTLGTRVGIAVQTGALGHHEEAERELRAIYEIQRLPHILGENHPETLSTRFYMASFMGDQKKFADAAHEFTELLSTYRLPEIFGEEHSATLQVRFNLAQQLAHQGRFRDAEMEFREVWEIERRSGHLGESHPDCLRTRYWIAKMLDAQNMSSEASDLLDGIEEGFAQHLGPDHLWRQELREYQRNRQ